MKRIAGYIRVSRLRVDDPGLSPENQKEKILLQAKMLGATEADVDFYIDLDISGKSIEKRTEFQKLLGNLPRYSYVIVYKLTRFCRSSADFHSTIRQLEKHNVSLISVSENFDTSTPIGRLIRNILVEFGEFEREIIAEQVRDNMHHNAQKGNWNGGRIPYGVDWVDKRFVKNHDAANVDFIYQTILERGSSSVYYIRNYFAQRNIPSPTGKPKWSKNTIIEIARNPFYCGYIRYGGKHHKSDIVSGWIDEETWQAVQEILNKNKKPSATIGSRHLLSGLIVCPECGSRLRIRYNGRNHTARRYVCHYRNDYTNRDRDKCSCPLLEADTLESAVARAILDLANDPEIIENYVQEYRRLMEVKKPDYAGQKRRLEKELQRIKKDMNAMFSLFRSNHITAEQLGEQNAVLLKEERIIQERLAEIKQQEAAAKLDDENIKAMSRLILTLNDLWPKMTMQEKRELINGLIKKIEITPDGVELDFGYFTLPVKYRLKTRTTILF